MSWSMPEREPHPLDPPLGASRDRRPGPRTPPDRRRAARPAPRTGCSPRAAAGAATPPRTRSRPSRPFRSVQPNGQRGPDLDPHLDPGAARSLPWLADQVHVDEERPRRPTIGSMSTARSGPFAAERAPACACVRRLTSAIVAAPATNPVAAAAAAWTAGSDAARRRLHRPDLGEHGQAVDVSSSGSDRPHRLGAQAASGACSSARLSHARDMVTSRSVIFKASSRRPGTYGRSCPPYRSIARFIDLFVSRIQPVSPVFWRVRSAAS